MKLPRARDWNEPVSTNHGRRAPTAGRHLGSRSLCMDISSELVHSLLPVFLATALGASMVTIGFIEGVAEATAAITKVFSGALSDSLGRRKPLVVLGYGLGAVTKPFSPLATSASVVSGTPWIRHRRGRFRVSECSRLLGYRFEWESDPHARSP